MSSTLNPTNESEKSGSDPHADKYDHPEAQVTGRGISIGIGIGLFAIIFTAGSLYMRRTRLEQTTEFFGPATITALQLADRVRLLPGKGQQFEPVDLTSTPGLGHLRKALLDQRHYQWATATDGDIDSVVTDESTAVILELADPSANRVPVTRIPIELSQGWISTPDRSRRVQVNDRVRPALQHQLTMLMNYHIKRYDLRD